jgi:hypothetical protein
MWIQVKLVEASQLHAHGGLPSTTVVALNTLLLMDLEVRFERSSFRFVPFRSVPLRRRGRDEIGSSVTRRRRRRARRRRVRDRRRAPDDARRARHGSRPPDR